MLHLEQNCITCNERRCMATSGKIQEFQVNRHRKLAEKLSELL